MSTRKRSTKQKKGNKRSSRWADRNAHSSSQTMTRISPDEYDVRLMYRTAAGLSSAVSGFSAKSFQTNAAFDVDPALGSTETYGFDEYAKLYSYYRVVGYSYEVTFVNGANAAGTPILAYVLNTNKDAAAIGTAFYLYSTQAHCQSKLISHVSPNQHTFRGKFLISQILGSKAVETADSFRSLVTTIPADLTWITLGVESIGGSTVSAVFDLKLIMHVRFYAREVDLSLATAAARVNMLLAAKEERDLKKRLLARKDSKGTLVKS